MTYFSQLEARQTEQPARYITHTRTHTTHHLLLWIYSHERPKNLLLGLLGTIREGISYACLCVRTCVCVCVCVCVQACTYVFVCLHETLSLSQCWPWAIWSCGLCCGVWDTCQCRLRLPLQVANQDAPWSNSGMETFRICHACHFCFSPVYVLTLKCFHAHWLFVRIMTELILWAPGLLLFWGQWP